MRLGSAPLLALCLAACATPRTGVQLEPPVPEVAVGRAEPVTALPATGSAAQGAWSIVAGEVRALTEGGELARADSVLAAFAARHDATCEGAEAGYARALLRLTGSGASGSGADALTLVERYMNSTCVTPARVIEASLVHRVVKQFAAADVTGAGEVGVLREQLEQTRRELERLKLRIIPP